MFSLTDRKPAKSCGGDRGSELEARSMLLGGRIGGLFLAVASGCDGVLWREGLRSSNALLTSDQDLGASSKESSFSSKESGTVVAFGGFLSMGSSTGPVVSSQGSSIFEMSKRAMLVDGGR
ncbi:hypothetical protein IEQ34_021075 [Dendrobium chrysotoxum]|uniref:Uncharacterized protein n=1 Tax=Dendrobium chrysotoxum TaxID=161865 RepID=A0AAV7G3U9_DENCH|nr:hypothetical protein IEQ34_021075 [Dendrobium chrysotoxum]